MLPPCRSLQDAAVFQEEQPSKFQDSEVAAVGFFLSHRPHDPCLSFKVGHLFIFVWREINAFILGIILSSGNPTKKGTPLSEFLGEPPPNTKTQPEKQPTP